uniref:Coiled-coil domain-containing protein 12 n=1 Tax=Parascaris univalens TaxID=6257 RepID=A0A915B6J2_PARUN
SWRMPSIRVHTLPFRLTIGLIHIFVIVVYCSCIVFYRQCRNVTQDIFIAAIMYVLFRIVFEVDSFIFTSFLFPRNHSCAVEVDGLKEGGYLLQCL